MTDPTPTTDAPATPEQAPPTNTPPPWERTGEPFDAARAWSLISNLRADLDAVKNRADTPATVPSVAASPPAPDAPEDLAVQLADLRTQLAREKVARAHSLPDDLVPLLGNGDETALTARAAALLDWRDKTTTPARPQVFRRPRVEELHGGADPTGDGTTDTDPAALAAAVHKRRPYR